MIPISKVCRKVFAVLYGLISVHLNANRTLLLNVLDVSECAQYLAVSQYSDNRYSQCFNMLLESGSHGCSQLLQDRQGLLDLENTKHESSS